MALPGRNAAVRIGGTGITFTTQAAAALSTASAVYQISDSTISGKPFAADATITVYDSTTTLLSATAYTLTRLNGSISFSSVSTGRNIIVTGQYVSPSTMTNAKEYSVSIAGTNLEDSVFGNAYVNRKQALKDVTGSIGAFFPGSTVLSDVIMSSSKQPTLLEFYSDTGTFEFRVWALIANQNLDASVDGLVEDGFEFEGYNDLDGNVISFTTSGTG